MHHNNSRWAPKVRNWCLGVWLDFKTYRRYTSLINHVADFRYDPSNELQLGHIFLRRFPTAGLGQWGVWVGVEAFSTCIDFQSFFLILYFYSNLNERWMFFVPTWACDKSWLGLRSARTNLFSQDIQNPNQARGKSMQYLNSITQEIPASVPDTLLKFRPASGMFSKFGNDSNNWKYVQSLVIGNKREYHQTPDSTSPNHPNYQSCHNMS